MPTNGSAGNGGTSSQNGTAEPSQSGENTEQYTVTASSSGQSSTEEGQSGQAGTGENTTGSGSSATSEESQNKTTNSTIDSNSSGVFSGGKQENESTQSGQGSASGEAESGANEDSTSESESAESTSQNSTELDSSESKDSNEETDTAESDKQEQQQQNQQEKQDEQTEPTDEKPEYDIELNRSQLIPGTAVSVTVTVNGNPESGVGVWFNDKKIGTTTSEGTVVGTVPFTQTLNVSVGGEAEPKPSLPPLNKQSSSIRFSLRPVLPSELNPSMGGQQASTQGTANYTVETNATLTVIGTPIPGEPVQLRATIGEYPLRGATVRSSESKVGTTNETGNLTVTLPSEQFSEKYRVSRGDVSAQATVSLVTDLDIELTSKPIPGKKTTVIVTAQNEAVPNATVTVGNQTATAADGRTTITLPDENGTMNLTAQRGVASGSRTITLRQLTVETEPEFGLPLPWLPLAVTSKIGGDPATDATVSVGGISQGSVGSNGILAANLPLTEAVPVTVSGYQQTATTTVRNPLLNLLGLGGMLLGLGALIVRSVYQNRGVGIQAARTLSRLLRRAVTSLIGLAWRLVQLVTFFRTSIRKLRGGVWSAVKAGLRFIYASVKGATDHLKDALVFVRTHSVREVFRRVWKLMATKAQTTNTGSLGTSSTVAHNTESNGSETVPEATYTIRDAWREFYTLTGTQNRPTRTPGECARQATMQHNLPESAVTTLCNAYRGVEYGRREPDELLAGAEEALSEIEAALDTEEGTER
ncbi:DUF4129 domain-containing protein [Haloferax profundi]|uniref:DUF4129 domain-containing protein n=1 Tax=Haloferax profundi TaxID=1544718 RepID=UPI0018D2725F|nr:DUF4129 domain-containing protein [Haloferax profundi]